MSDYTDWIEAGFRVFGLYPMDENGNCTCRRGADCEAAGKHPMAKNWQVTPDWSDEQLEGFDAAGHFNNYGVLCSGMIVIDVDARNGGVESYNKLVEAVPEVAGAGCIVNTGSGGGSMHLFFRSPAGVALRQKHPDYEGIDFKSSGYVVGAGSMHKSGNRYEMVYGSPDEIDDAPDALVALLAVPKSHRARLGDAEMLDVSDDDIKEMLALMSPDCDYDTWVKVGMAIHDATSGAGFALWDDWSSGGESYNADVMMTKWHSFGKTSNPVTLGTLIHLSGWQPPVTFNPDAELLAACVADDKVEVDLLRPPGLVGEIAAWINSTAWRRRDALAVQAALYCVSACGGLRHYEPDDNTRSNMFLFGVAGSASGKNNPFGAVKSLLLEVGIASSMAGNFKSQQEVIRNLIEHQAANYVVDEVGEVMAKVTSGGAVYLDGLIGELMTVFTSSHSFVPLTGDMRREIRAKLEQELAQLYKKADRGDDVDAEIEAAIRRIDSVDSGIVEPFLQIQGFTTPERFEAIMTPDMVCNGFLGRALIAKEVNDAPPRQKNRKRDTTPPPEIVASLRNLYYGGNCDMKDRRIQRQGPLIAVPLTDKAAELKEQYFDAFDDMARDYAERSSLAAIPLRAGELMNKVALTLGMSAGVISEHDMNFAYQYVMRDIRTKTHIANAHNDDESEALLSKIVGRLPDDKRDARPLSVIYNKFGGKNKPDRDVIEKALQSLVKGGHVRTVETKHPVNGKVTIKYYKGANT